MMLLWNVLPNEKFPPKDKEGYNREISALHACAKITPYGATERLD